MEVVYLPKVKKFVESLSTILAGKILGGIDVLEKYGNLLEMPISKPLGRGLFELRITGDNHIRIFYCFHKNNAYLLHAVTKKDRAIRKRDMDIARNVMKIVASL